MSSKIISNEKIEARQVNTFSIELYFTITLSIESILGITYFQISQPEVLATHYWAQTGTVSPTLTMNHDSLVTRMT